MHLLHLAEKVRIATAVASVLAATHRTGLVHGALSPGSVVLAASGEVKVTEFRVTTMRLDEPRAEARRLLGLGPDSEGLLIRDLGIDRDLYVPLLEAITGIHRSWADLEKTGERIWNLTRLYWSREIDGFGRDWDQPSPRFYSEAPATGATAGQITRPEDVRKLLDMYYEQRGWDSTGHLTPATLERLSLTEFALN